MQEYNELSERERDILRLVATGASNKEIAVKLNISANTVKVHLRNIFAKIGAASRTEAAMFAVQSGLVVTQLPVTEAVPVEIETIAQPGGSSPSKYLFLISSIFLLLVFVGMIILLVNLRNSNAQSSQSNTPVPAPHWEMLSAMPTPRHSLAAAVYENKIYAIGGENETGVIGTLEQYDPASGKWTKLTQKPTGVSDIQATVLGGKIYIPGGRLASGAATDLLEIYDPRNDSWLNGAKLPQAVSAYALAAYEGKLYLFGGWDGDEYLDIVLEYTPDQDAWRHKSTLPAARGYAAAVLLNEKLYILGGFDGKTALKRNDIYTPSLDDGTSDPWVAGTDLPRGVYGMGGAGLMNTIFLIGGEGDTDTLIPAVGYQTSIQQWQEILPPMQTGITRPGLAALENRLYRIGGKADGQAVSEVESYQVFYITVLPFIR